MDEIVEHSTTGKSPFDAIRRVREDGSECWSARDLQSLMAYTRWEKFENPLNRARATADNQGHDAEHHFRQSVKMVQIGSGAAREVADFELTRFAAYLVAMNGDPNMPEVAAAQAYFAVRTREAEVRAENSRPELPRDYEEALLALVDKERERKREVKAREAAESYARELEPKADSYDQFLSADGTYSIGAVAKMLGQSQNKLFDLLRNSGILIAKGAMRNTPYQQYMHHFRVVAFDFERADQTRGTSYTTRVQPSGVQFISRKLGIALVEVSA